MRISIPAMTTFLIFLASDSVLHAADPMPMGYQILSQMDAGGQFVDPDQKIRQLHWKLFQKLDSDDDWELSAEEATEDSPGSMTMDLFASSDTDSSGVLSHDEFSRHRIICDEAVAIFQRMDQDGNSKVSREEFLTGSMIQDKALARATFVKLDTSGDRTLTQAEMLPVWDRWARQEPLPVTARLIVKQKTYELPSEFQTAEFRKRIQSETDLDKLPPAPEVRLVLELTNKCDRPLAVWPRGSVDDPEVTVTGEGIIRPESLQGGGGSGGSTTPQPVILPGKTFRVRVDSLNPQGPGFDNLYWTKPGDYQVSASYPVYENLKPHLPQLFPNQPKPNDKRKKYVVTSPPVTLTVVARESSGTPN